MSIGIDIHPYYQRAVNWSTVRDHSDVAWCYVKASDGGYRYRKTVAGVDYVPDTHVAGAKSVGIPVGVYHYAQLSNPEAQAAVLLGEHRRLGASLPPMLDLEAPFQANSYARDFANAFLRRVADGGYRPCVYMSSSWAKTLRPDQWGIPGLIIWVASYGPNNGRQNALTGGYPGRYDIHQYTSTGRVNGISSDTDLNATHGGFEFTQQGDEMDWSDTFDFTHPDGVTRKIKYGDAILNLWAERFYGSKTAPWTGPSGRAIDLGEAAELPVELSEESAALLAEALAERGIGGATPAQVQEAVRAAFQRAGAAEAGQ